MKSEAARIDACTEFLNSHNYRTTSYEIAAKDGFDSGYRAGYEAARPAPSDEEVRDQHEWTEAENMAGFYWWCPKCDKRIAVEPERLNDKELPTDAEVKKIGPCSIAAVSGDGWHEINGPEDLPKEDGNYDWWPRRGGLNRGRYFSRGRFADPEYLWVDDYSHWKRIDSPKETKG